MNIVYLLTNLNKKEGEKRFYIGSKAECRLEIIDNLSVIIDIKTEKPYLGSATCKEMKQDILNFHKFSATILEIVGDKKNILSIENKYILQKNAVFSNEYYNLGEAMLGGFSYDQNAIINFFGEKRKDYNASKSGFSKRTKTAKKYGFESIYSFSKWIYEESKKHKYFTEVAKILKCERHTPSRFIEPYNMKKCLEETSCPNNEIRVKVRDLYVKGASIYKIAELLQLEIPTIDFYMDKFLKDEEKVYIVARRKNLTEKELKNKIMYLFLKGKSIAQLSEELGMNTTSATRYFNEIIRELLKPENFINT